MDAAVVFPIDDLMACIGAGERHRMYLKLKNSKLNINVLLDTYRLFKTIMNIPLIEKKFDSESKQRFLVHLIPYHLAIQFGTASNVRFEL